MNKSILVLLILLPCHSLFAQKDFMTVLPDSTGRDMFSDFVGMRLWAADYSINTINQDLAFKYVSVNTGYTMQHNFDVRNITNTPNIGIGIEENLGSHLLLHFADISLGYSRNMWNWNIGAGMGYFLALDKKRNVRFRASIDIFYEDISYSLGSYSDTTGYGFVVNGNNIGANIQNVKYVNNILSASLTASIMYRTNSLDYFAGIGYNYSILTSESINFYYTRVNLSDAVYNPAGNSVGSGILNLGNYIIQAGIIREFGL